MREKPVIVLDPGHGGKDPRAVAREPRQGAARTQRRGRSRRMIRKQQAAESYRQVQEYYK
ncbi:hypothetical protein [Desulforamulus putei]|uniref:N-acetylmuramoyl-L-alanine amidase n=1 Tax=Desulforamulus putei DSM 12395 TaxID=1121429 RepID=A0A1M4SG64_9FIRM|nr:hypothetical protein [Desulforamulus putei]SHE30987.1 hypothetical protein SAMN02745133_00103 [Desulforamulus putei DSM 12395]